MAKSSAGLTLIEVLIALAIISIAMTAIIKAVTQDIQATAYLQDKMTAAWVGQQVLNEARVGVLKIENRETSLKQITTMLGKPWHWQLTQDDTPNERIKKITVEVANQDNAESPIISLESYVYRSP